ncbi:MAG: hypothetical protein A2946_04190 [Candidatus Liptonbacteria bacterium RIFCSPLOWO2_01_FULL_53_13]|uniref:AB hydrolase-1 domain-containing protein n=1 Tax=Candidatus Liptonbacteria bacterium RIFCSPLOWO2_01_FULL_53_13 TaxID=1798651 RepID=A0A1G2CKK2_9BACT|nr:MAG: hypothetical protein A2946_04190 [Candidatus Liptonbacteria bacterium RIFCSPLOWO2_01_FULL_53_13]
MEKIILTTTDSATIAGNYYPGNAPRGVLLVHMMPATKESWGEFAPRLAEKGYHALAIDLRGHGDSASGPDGYQNLHDADHQKSILDVEAGMAFLRTKNISEGDIALVGASIGANLSLQYLAAHPGVKTAVLLSAGLNYYGIETLPLAQALRQGQRLLLAASEDDMRRSGSNCAAMATKIYEHTASDAEKKLITYHHAGHGTDMFGKESPDLAEEILAWLR